eukprot:SAG31_NODE_27_length_32731_cov_1443.130393_33_plen_84_part_00
MNNNNDTCVGAGRERLVRRYERPELGEPGSIGSSALLLASIACAQVDLCRDTQTHSPPIDELPGPPFIQTITGSVCRGPPLVN